MRDAFARAGYRLSPLHRLIQTKFTWPLADAFRARGRATRTAIVASAAAAAIAAGTAGAMIAPEDAPAPDPTAVTAVASSSPAATPASETTVLQGVTPDFRVRAADNPVPTPAAPKPSVEPAQVAWQFAQAFVAYEVGRSSDKSSAVFAETATKPLVKALAKDPPRLPADRKVPQARVLNVVLGEAAKEQVTASVSLVRMRAISEVRLTLTKEGKDWRVAQVLG